MRTHIYDLNNWVRVKSWEDQTQFGGILRGLWNETRSYPGDSIWVSDGKGANTLRRKEYPEYKAKRPPVSDDIHQTMELLKAILCHTRTVWIEVPGYEADDVIAAIAESDCMIYSTDGDLSQLMTRPGVSVAKIFKDGEVAARHIRAYKTLVGDHSDNIHGLPGFGKKAWEGLDKDLFVQMMTESRPDIIPRLQISPRHQDWMDSNFESLKVLWKITGFYEVPPEEIQKNLVIGKDDPATVERLLTRWMQ